MCEEEKGRHQQSASCPCENRPRRQSGKPSPATTRFTHHPFKKQDNSPKAAEGKPSDKSKDQKKEKDKKNGKKDTNDTKKEKKGTPKPEKGDPKKDATEEYQEVCWPTWLRLQVAASRQAPLGRLPIRRTVATTSRRRTISRRRRMKSPRRRRKRRSWLLARRASVSGLNHRLRYASRFQLASTPLSILRRSRSQRRPVRRPRTTMFVAHEMHMLIFDL